jgi:hypothetical protein
VNILGCLTEVIDLYENGRLMAAESLERSVLTSLERSRKPENRVALGHLSEPCSELSEKLLSLRAVNSYLASVYMPRSR